MYEYHVKASFLLLMTIPLLFFLFLALAFQYLALSLFCVNNKCLKALGVFLYHYKMMLQDPGQSTGYKSLPSCSALVFLKLAISLLTLSLLQTRSCRSCCVGDELHHTPLGPTLICVTLLCLSCRNHKSHFFHFFLVTLCYKLL